MNVQNRKSSDVWNFFSVIQNEKHIAICDLCKQKLSYKSSVSNLRKHIQRKHPTVKIPVSSDTISHVNSDETENKVLDTDHENIGITSTKRTLLPGASPVSLQDDDGVSIKSTVSAQSTAYSCMEIITRRKIEQTRQNNKLDNYIPRKLTVPVKRKIDNEFVKLFYLDYQPYRIVEDKGFRLFVKALNSSYELPTRQLILKTMIPSLYEKCQNSLREILKKIDPFVCLTTDCWTSLNNDSFMAITVHFIDEEFEIHSALLNCAVFYGSHTIENLSRELIEVTRHWALEKKVILAVSDNASNVKGAINSTGWKFLGSFAHTLNLVVQDALKLPTIKPILDKLKTVVSHFKRSSKATAKLNEIQKNSGIQVPKKILQDVVTRWNSTFYMFERFIDLEVPLRSTIALLDANLPTISMAEWGIMKDICKILRPFESATRSVSGENYMSASLVIVITNGLLDVCNELSRIPDLSEISKSVLKKYETGLRERLGNMEYSNTMAICTFLDPRFKTFCFKNADAVERVRKNVISALVEIIDSTEKNKIDSAESNNEINLSDEPVSKKPKTNEENAKETIAEFSIWSSLDKIASGHGSIKKNSTSRALMELQRYMEEDLLERNKNPMQWWKNCSYMYPNLSKLVRQKCCALATSVPCERLFSKAGNLLHEKRTRLSTKKLQQMLFLNMNSKFMK